MRRLAFNGEAATWIALQRTPAEPPTPGGPPSPGPVAPAASMAAAAVEHAAGNDLTLRELATGAELTLENVGDWAFDRYSSASLSRSAFGAEAASTSACMSGDHSTTWSPPRSFATMRALALSESFKPMPTLTVAPTRSAWSRWSACGARESARQTTPC